MTPKTAAARISHSAIVANKQARQEVCDALRRLREALRLAARQTVPAK